MPDALAEIRILSPKRYWEGVSKLPDSHAVLIVVKESFNITNVELGLALGYAPENAKNNAVKRATAARQALFARLFSLMQPDLFGTAARMVDPIHSPRGSVVLRLDTKELSSWRELEKEFAEWGRATTLAERTRILMKMLPRVKTYAKR